MVHFLKSAAVAVVMIFPLSVLIAGTPVAASHAGVAPALIATSGPGPRSVAADINGFRFEEYSADLYLTRDARGRSEMTTVETLRPRFPDFDQNRGIVRSIPADYDSVDLETRVVSVKDADGADVPFATDTEDSFVNVAVGTDEYVHGLQTYVITYTQRDVIRAFSDTRSDELYWDINGTGWDQSFGTVSARVHIDPELVASLSGNQACYVGTPTTSTRCGIERADATDGGAVFTSAVTSVGPRETLTMAIGFDPGTFVPGAQRDRSVWVTVIPLALVVLILVGLIALAVRRVLVWRHAPGRGIVVPQYTVPHGVDLLVAADVLGRASRAVPATFVSFAVRRVMRILDYVPTGIEQRDASYTFQLLDATPTAGQERAILQVLFGQRLTPGDLKALNKTDTTLAKALTEIRKEMPARVIAEGYRARPSRSLAAWLTGPLYGLAILAILVGFFAPMFLVGTGFTTAAVWVGIFGLVATGIVSARPSLLTPKGAELKEYLEGMRDYMVLAEQERFRMLQSPDGAQRVEVGDGFELVKIYEKLLPFAVLWGVEQQWAQQLSVQYEQTHQQPDWFVGSDAFNAALFASSLARFQSSAITATTPPSASGSSGGSFSGGSFGGGFSGGGGGGGGGGGR